MLAVHLATLALLAQPVPDDAPSVQGTALSGSFALWPGSVEEIDVRGPRPTREVKSALLTITPLLSGCVRPEAPEPALLLVEVDLLAAGFADRLTVLQREDATSAIDEACVRATMRALPLRDRGLEPPSRMVLRLATTAGGVVPPAGLAPVNVGRALELRRDEIARCVVEARQKKPALAGTVVVRWTVHVDGAVAEVEAHEGTLESMDARVCIAHEIAQVRFAGERSAPERVAWPLTFDVPGPVRAKATAKTAWDAPTLFQFIGCMP